MQRYLLNIAYLGTRYSGAAHSVGCVTVLSKLTDAINALNPKNDVNLIISSRTDAGVHALNSTVHLDLESNTSRPLLPISITQRVNKKLEHWRDPIRVLRTTAVSNEFCARRYAINRTYLYRFAVEKNKSPKKRSRKDFNAQAFIPIEELQRCYFVENTDFDIERMRAAAKQMEGYHDFRSFMKASKEQKTFHPKFCTRRIHSIQIKPGNTIATCMNYDKTLAEYDFWDIEFNSKAYFYRQIRNMVGTLISAAQGFLSAREIYEMLTIPSKHISTLHPVPAHGLYLVNVDYDNDALNKMTVDISSRESSDRI